MSGNGSLRKKRWRIGLQERLGVLFISLVLLTGLSIALIGYRMVRRTEETFIEQLAGQISQAVLDEIDHTVYGPVQTFIGALSLGILPKAHTLGARLEALPLLRVILDSHSAIGGIKIGYEDGSFFGAKKLLTKAERRSFEAPEGAVYVATNRDRVGDTVWINRFFYDADMVLLNHISHNTEPVYDPRKRAWYKTTIDRTGIVESEPFIMTVSEQPTITFSQAGADGGTVVGIDITLTQLSTVLQNLRPTPGARIGLFKEDGTLLASTTGATAGRSSDIRMRLREDFTEVGLLGLQKYEQGMRGLVFDADAEGEKWVLFLGKLDRATGTDGFVVLAMPQDEILDESEIFKRYVAYAAAGILIASISASWLAIRLIFSPLRKLATRARNIQDLHLKQEEHVVSGVEEIDALSEGMDHMQESIQKLLSITKSINAEKDFTRLIHHVLREAMGMCNSDGAIIGLLGEDGEGLGEGVVCWLDRSGNFEYRSLTPEQMGDAPLVADIFENSRLIHEQVARSDPRSNTISLAMGFEDPEAGALDLLGMPLTGRMGEKLGVFGLARRIRSGEEKYQSQQMVLVEGLGKIVAIAIDNHRLLEKQCALLDAVIQIVAGAIDAKSPYTGGHCARVPILFQMMLQAACDEKNGAFKDFSLDDDGWEEARLAAWLHDWGKVTTPEYVMDKATKLETMYDRIHEIRTRFEVLKRDAEIACLRAILGGNDARTETLKLQTILRELDDDFAFVAICNRGEERLEEKDLERLRKIGSRTWVRTLDKRLGVSRDERARMDDTDGIGLPAIERLLADKPEHLIERNGADAIAPDNPWGFKIETPEYLYNRGELHNLSIRAGTLAAEERYKINDHITQTIVMLSKVPLPKHLKNVPEIAGAHHETMDGRGYPRRLAREEMSWSARMMAVADIFEALTASDRPYKSSKTLSEALAIMEEFKQKNHIDEDVYNLFLNADIPRKYAKLCLKPEQNDMVENIPFFWYPAS